MKIHHKAGLECLATFSAMYGAAHLLGSKIGNRRGLYFVTSINAISLGALEYRNLSIDKEKNSLFLMQAAAAIVFNMLLAAPLAAKLSKGRVSLPFRSSCQIGIVQLGVVSSAYMLIPPRYETQLSQNNVGNSSYIILSHDPVIFIEVERSHLKENWKDHLKELAQSYQTLNEWARENIDNNPFISPTRINPRFVVNFHEEKGADAGGITKEYLDTLFADVNYHECGEELGKVWMLLYHSDYFTGQHAPPEVFKSILELSAKDIDSKNPNPVIGLEFIHEVARGMKELCVPINHIEDPNRYWDDVIRKLTAEELSSGIQGTLNREMVADQIQPNRETKETALWLQEWIRVDATEEELKAFLKFATGGSFMSKGDKITIAKSSTARFIAQTCYNKLEVPVITGWTKDEFIGYLMSVLYGDKFNTI